MSAPSSRSGVNTKAFVAAWLGWAFDGLDGYLYAMVALPFVTELVGKPEQAKQPAAWIQCAFLMGWAIGGAVFGRIGDRIGRSLTLTLTILTYAVFTGLSAVAMNWQMLLVFRFISALGIGGEWAAGSTLVAETLHVRHRAWASATLQSGYVSGMIGAAVTVGLFGGLDPRYVFIVGVIPALFTVWIRRAVPEPEIWKGERQHKAMPAISDLFAPGIRSITWRTLAMTCLCLTTIWAFLFFNSQIVQALDYYKSLAKPEQGALSRNVTIEFCLWTILGCFSATYLAKWMGYRKAFAVYLAGSCLAFLYGFHISKDQLPSTPLSHIRLYFDLAMFFGTGVFAIFPLYIPALFPTLLRTTGAGFCYNFGRMVAGIGTLVGGWITAKAGGPAMAVWWVGFLYIPGVVLSLFMPEVPYKEDAAQAEPVLTPG